MSVIQKDLVWTSGRVNASGIRSIAFWINKDDIVEYPDFVANPATVSEQVNLDGDFVLKEGAFFKRIYTTQGKGKVEFEPTGEKDCEMFLNKASLRYPDISDESKALAKSTMNNNVLFVIGNRTSGANKPVIKHVVIGGKEYDTKVKAGGTSGDNPGSDKGLTLEIEAPDFSPLPGYIGIIQLEDGQYDTETDVFTATADLPVGP